MKVSAEWLETLGVGSRVFVLDTGCNKPVKEARNFTCHPMEMNSYHGQTCVNIIADCNWIGLASQAEVYVAKVIAVPGTNWQPFEDALQWALEADADVVNMSFAADEFSPRMKRQLAELDDRGTICVAAWAGSRWPGASPHVLPVGRPSDQQLPPGVVRAQAPMAGRDHLLAHPSFSAALVSGVAACAKAWNSGINRASFLRHLGSTHH